MKPRFTRPTPRSLFLTGERQPQVYFYTSNLPKFMQASLVFERAGLALQHFRSRRDPYAEDYSLGKRDLLARALKEILGNVGSGSLFFVEDTSLRIDALSDTFDYPGLAVKEWFQDTPFEVLDKQLRSIGSNRRASVYSDIALHLPGLMRPVYFSGETSGVIANSEPTFIENRQHPWLTPQTFNGWLIPDGANKRLGEMTLEESYRFDFRIQAIELLLERIEEYAAILNLGGQGYRLRQPRGVADQPSLFAPQPEGQIIIVVGYTCSGKTTLAEYARAEHSMRFVEASSVMRVLAKEKDCEGSDSFASAQNLLSTYGRDVVARNILDLYTEDLLAGCVISGFRTIEELEVIREHYPHARIVVIEAAERIRFQRCVNRDREEGPKDLATFGAIDSAQRSFGLVRIAQDFADYRIVNEGSMEDYHTAIDALITKPHVKYAASVSANVQPRVASDQNQLFRCLGVLDDAGRPLTCDEIQTRTTALGHAVRHNNANKVLKRVPELARRLELERENVRYEITDSGRAYLRYFARLLRETRAE